MVRFMYYLPENQAFPDQSLGKIMFSFQYKYTINFV